MEINKLIQQLQECLKDGKTHLTLLANTTNGEDTDYDLMFNNLEVWNDGEETATLFFSNITVLDFEGNPLSESQWQLNKNK